eukprot:NODE_10881_length_476_cov_0.914040_g10858_i0.p1 GENE.NODE_10881_length_476_cov_0.914040_g10858_i0~~NODE_10881_length_476_cov_0.914040_g10858_i0.p1  ORF type:complete len:101 (-),score=6.10 NODE_10881_length_476_cov_0.914040_g10858_i0:16-318(-)
MRRFPDLAFLAPGPAEPLQHQKRVQTQREFSGTTFSSLESGSEVKSEHFLFVVVFFQDGLGKIDTDRAERRFPTNTDTDRSTDGPGVINFTGTRTVNAFG